MKKKKALPIHSIIFLSNFECDCMFYYWLNPSKLAFLKENVCDSASVFEN